MRKTITIVGVGLRKTGVSKKTNRPYDFTELFITFDDSRRCEGLCAELVAVDSRVLDGHTIFPGVVVDVEMWTQNFKTMVGAIYE